MVAQRAPTGVAWAGGVTTQVATVGGGPVGLRHAQILDRHRIENVVVERQSYPTLLGSRRVGVLEWGWRSRMDGVRMMPNFDTIDGRMLVADGALR